MSKSNPHSQFLIHPSGQTTHLLIDDFTDPWKPSETILIQHGFARHSAFWYHWIPPLSAHYRIIRRDARGHGLSSAPAPGSAYAYSLDTILDEIINTLDQLGLEKVHFLGESTSGMIGEALAAKYPERLLSLTVCSSPTYLPPKAQEMLAFGHKDWATACREMGSRSWAEALNKVPGTMAHPDPRYTQWWLEQVAISTGEGFAGYAEFLAKLDTRPYLKDIRVPMLILAPARSAMTSVEDQTNLRDSIGRSAEMVVVEGRGHEIYIDRPEECQEALLRFLKGLKKKEK